MRGLSGDQPMRVLAIVALALLLARLPLERIHGPTVRGWKRLKDRGRLTAAKQPP